MFADLIWFDRSPRSRPFLVLVRRPRVGSDGGVQEPYGCEWRLEEAGCVWHGRWRPLCPWEGEAVGGARVYKGLCFPAQNRFHCLPCGLGYRPLIPVQFRGLSPLVGGHRVVCGDGFKVLKV